MLSHKVTISSLQKAYDESYLTCSTAVYYESQGNEAEARRCWRAALDQIRDHRATKVLSNYAPGSETEQALIESLQQLELQCKERIDLLEALRVSREEDASFSSQQRPGTRASTTGGNEEGWIGEGTIPAITYSELSRPALPPRPSIERPLAPIRINGGNRAGDDQNGSPTIPARSSQQDTPSFLRPRPAKSPSPDRHSMRTTLRTGRLGDRSQRPSLPLPGLGSRNGPGANQAASLAWTSTASGEEKSGRSRPLSSSRSGDAVAEQGAKRSDVQPARWDSHSRRLVVPRHGRVTTPTDSDSPVAVRHSDEYPFPQASQLSISAASSALGARLVGSGTERSMSDAESIRRQRTAPPTIRRPGISPGSGLAAPSPAGRHPAETDEELADRRKSASDVANIKRKPVGQPATRAGLAGNPLLPDKESDVDELALATQRRRGEANVTSPGLRTRKDETREVRGAKWGKGNYQVEEEEEEEGAQGNERREAQAAILKDLPPGVDAHAAKQVLNEVVAQGDEVHWNDIAGLDVAKNALRETVVYPFLRPDLFMGLREPARGMLLFGPPGTGKTMLARAVATESKSTFFSISASSLTSKYLGESEKLVRALFALAKMLAPSIIFVDEIDSLLSQRSGSGEHEATRRIKTEFLIQWSDLQRAAAGREDGNKDRARGDANRVLVLAATNLPWTIDEAARRRFVRRQYIPLPEADTRATQLRTLLSQQKHQLDDSDIDQLVELTDGFSGSDITALAKDAAMGPLRSLGEALLHMSTDDIRPIALSDFVSSLATIRPSVDKEGLKEYEDWARQFGERGG